MLLCFGLLRTEDALDFVGKPPGHLEVTELFGKRLAFLKNFDRARYVALSKVDAGLAKDARVTLSLGCGIHEACG